MNLYQNKVKKNRQTVVFCLKDTTNRQLVPKNEYKKVTFTFDKECTFDKEWLLFYIPDYNSSLNFTTLAA